MSAKRKQKDNPRIKNPPPPKGYMLKTIRAMTARVNRKPQIPRGR